eukprot:scaffold70717_cov42-Cyclotella_meneghiniana.AAC.7
MPPLPHSKWRIGRCPSDRSNIERPESKPKSGNRTRTEARENTVTATSDRRKHGSSPSIYSRRNVDVEPPTSSSPLDVSLQGPRWNAQSSTGTTAIRKESPGFLLFPRGRVRRLMRFKSLDPRVCPIPSPPFSRLESTRSAGPHQPNHCPALNKPRNRPAQVFWCRVYFVSAEAESQIGQPSRFPITS